MHKSLVTGVNGFVGQHLARALHNSGCDVLGASQEAEANPKIKTLLSGYYKCDLTNPDEISQLPLENIDSIINLAGLAKVGASFGQADLYKKVNVEVLSNLCKALLDKGLSSVRILAISTGAVYDPAQSPPFSESSPTVKPDETNPYVSSKLAMEHVAYEQQKHGLSVLVVRPFNHVGPGQLPGFLVPDLAEQIVDVMAGKQKTIKIGDLSSQRDYTDVRDVVRAYTLLATIHSDSLNATTYNVCSGQPLSGQEILRLLLQSFNANNIEVEIDQSRIRPNDPPMLYGNIATLKSDTGWKPEITIKQTIADFVAWRRQEQG